MVKSKFRTNPITVFICTLILCLSSCSESELPTTILTFDNSEVINTNFLGLGVQWSTYPHADANQDKWGNIMMDKKRWEFLYKRLDYMKPQFIRILDHAEQRYFRGIINQSTPNINFDRMEMHALYQVLDYCQENSITVIMGEWNPPWQLRNNQYSIWVKMIGKYMHHLIVKKKYTCIKFYSLINKPNTITANTKGDYNQYHTAISLVKKEFEKVNINQQLSLLGPSIDPLLHYSKNGLTSLDWLQKSLSDTVYDAIDIQVYPSENNILSNSLSTVFNLDKKIIKQKNKPLIISEFGIRPQKNSEESYYNDSLIALDEHASRLSQMKVYQNDYAIYTSDAVIQLLQAKADGIIAWHLDDAMFTEANDGNKNQLIKYGMWNSLSDTLFNNPSDMKLRPWYFSWSWISKNLPRGSQVIKLTNNNHQKIKGVGTINNNDYVILLSNLTDRDEYVEINFTDNIVDKTFYSFSIGQDDTILKFNSMILPKNKHHRIGINHPLFVKLSAREMLILTTKK
ncbi:hypothetical protein [Flammeovirga kamogawensis]|uniref:Glycoside hydrolase family 5 domain-containing protein n=1 Tax=Flammeovirga kamogawensis TaxID=373891 RepID=A0ABX8GRB7_9BACT|nr:hypothetical protein [Flammeovirga kamogawensis]MBB6463188.1 hypothetical protein [Flammeovirga kamogawensis]QWG05959.1 hypothetical protein KM029_11325 [Flammeovirga kamogawensis]TRX67785.1 hypothetical protein EO216_06335 [Flammeovirga kamogawensis]